jgi:hypothetical protein
MTERDQSTRRGAAERRELEAAGWEPKGHGAKTIHLAQPRRRPLVRPSPGRKHAEEGRIMTLQRLMYKHRRGEREHKNLSDERRAT